MITSSPVGFRENLWFRAKTLEYRPIPSFLRKALIGRVLPDPFAQGRTRFLNGREVIFLHVPKTGGTSLAKALDIPNGHVPLSRFVTSDADRFRAGFSIAFVRNPWDRLYSSFNYLHTAAGINKSRDARWALQNISPYETFESFVMALKDPAVRRRIWQWPHFRPQIDWVGLPGEDSVNVSYLGRFETLHEDFSTLCEMLGANVDLPHTRRAQRYGAKHFTPEMIAIIGEIYHKDSTLFDYDGPEAALRDKDY